MLRREQAFAVHLRQRFALDVLHLDGGLLHGEDLGTRDPAVVRELKALRL